MSHTQQGLVRTEANGLEARMVPAVQHQRRAVQLFQILLLRIPKRALAQAGPVDVEGDLPPVPAHFIPQDRAVVVPTVLCKAQFG
jgi:hypothetical protein